MPYKDKAKQKEYQRNWVRHKRNGSTDVTDNVEPIVEPFEVVNTSINPKCNKPEPQSYNPMMVGYVPPQD